MENGPGFRHTQMKILTGMKLLFASGKSHVDAIQKSTEELLSDALAESNENAFD